MLKLETIEQLETRFKISGLVAAFQNSEEVDIEVPELNVLTDDELQGVKDTEYNNGKNNGVEVAIKKYKADNGLEFTGKTLDGLVRAAEAKALTQAEKEPNEQVKTLQDSLKKVQDNYTALEALVAEKDGQVSKATAARELYRQVPTLGEGLGVDKIVKLMELDGYDFKLEGNELVPYQNGTKVTDKLSKALPVKDVITGYAKENKLISEPAPKEEIKGRGGEDSKGSAVFTTLSRLKQHYADNGKSTNGKAFMEEASQLKKENPEFDLNS